MSVKLIAENILTADKFLSATEQEGEYIGQPVPDSGNTGDFRLLSKGDIADFTYNGTCTGEVPDTSSVIDSVLAAFGDNYFIGGTVTFTSGTNNGQTGAVTDFAQATGDLTCAAFPNVVNIGDDFTLTVAFATRDFRVELITSGDAGGAVFKWSHDGGTKYFGRDKPTQANWLAERELYDNVTAAKKSIMLQDSNGDVLGVFNNAGATNNVYAKRSTNGALTFGAANLVYATGSDIKDGIVLSSGRILFSIGAAVFYSDDDGETWTLLSQPAVIFTSIIQLPNGNIVGAYNAGTGVAIRISNDEGTTWTTTYIEVSDAANTQKEGVLTVLATGDILCVYSTDEDAVNDFELKGKISSTGGTTWGSVIDIIDFGADIDQPSVIMDIDGTVFVAAREDTANQTIVFTYSGDHGVTWAAKATLKTVGAVDLGYPYLSLINGHLMICTYIDITNSDVDYVSRGMWEAYSANACPCAKEVLEQKLICDVSVIWHGGAGGAGDKWQFDAEYDYTMSNIIEDSPLKPWRSEQDDIFCSIVIDLGANERFLVDGVGFFNCNIRKLTFEMNTINDWAPIPPVHKIVSFDLATGVVDSVSGNYVNDASLMVDYKDHELKANKHFLRMTSGTDDDVTWTILDNVGDYIVIDTTAATNIAATDTFVIFQDHIAKTFTGGAYRFIRPVAISNQHTSDDYYQIGMAVMGKAITLSRGFAVGYSKDHHYDIEMLRSPKGGMIPIKGRDRKRIFSLTWPAAEAAREEIIALLDYIEGKNIVLIPDDSNMKNCYLVKLIGDVSQKHRFRNRFDTGPLLFEEV